jgi:hypothetical protein
MGDGTTFEIDIPVTGTPGVNAAASAIDKLAAQLTAAEKASLDASAAMQAGAIAFKQSETSADRAAKSVEKIGIAADAQRGKLAEALAVGDAGGAAKAEALLARLEKRQESAAQKATDAKLAMEAQAAALDKLKVSASNAEQAAKKLADDLDKQKKAAEEGEINFRKLASGLGRLGPIGESAGRPIVELAEGFSKLGDVFSGLSPKITLMLGMAALVAVFAAITAGVVAATVAIAKWSIGLADAENTRARLAAGIARSVSGGDKLDDQLTHLTEVLPLTREELSDTAKQLADSGLRGDALTNALNRTAIAAAKLKFGPEFEQEMLSLDQQSKVFHSHISELFGGLKIAPALEGLQTLGALFDENTASGKAIKAVFESLFQPLIDEIPALSTIAERFFLQLEVWSLTAMIALKEHQGIVKAALAATAGVITGIVVVALYLLIPALYGVATAALAATWPFLAVVAAFSLVGVAIYEMIAHWDALKAWFASIDVGSMALDMIHGLANGIANAGGAVFDALKGVVMGAVDGVKGLLGIHSPSTLLEQDVGENMGEGAALGIDHKTARVQNSLETMLAPPESRAPSAPQVGSAATPRGSASLENVVFNFYGVEGAEQAESRFRGLLTMVLEGDAAQLGAMAPAT